MENVRRFQSNSLQKKHFAKIHEKVQYKYEEMQQKLNKSKSIDSLLVLNDNNYLFSQENCMSSNDLSCSSEVLIENRGITKQTALVEDVPRNNAVLHYLDTNLSKSESVETQDVDVFENNFFGENFSKTSFESLNEVSKESIENLRPSTPPTPSPQKLSIRDKIGSRITAVKEKRRKEDKAKNVFKDTKKKGEKMVLSNTTKQDVIKVSKRTKIATVTIALIEAIGLKDQASEEKLICRFRLGTEKYKSKTSKVIDSVAKWHELINLNMYEDNVVEITLWDKETLLGRCFIDLLELEKETTHKLYIRLEELEAVELFILLTISGISLLNTVIDMEDYEKTQRNIDTIRKKFAWYKLREDSGVGYLSMIVYGAKGLACSDCYCVIEMGNERLQTHTESKTNDPNWMKIFTFTIKDITSILEITIYDEKKNEEVGRLSLPLLSIRNGHKIWYTLKDSAQRERAKGNHPRILLEMKVTWNIVKSSLRVIQPKENKYIREEEKFDRRIFYRNITRAKAVTNWTLDAFRVVKTCFEWESKKWNVIALTIWLLACYFFKAWMLPLMLLMPFIWYRPQKYYLVNWRKLFKRKSPIDDDEDIKSEKEEKNTSLRQKINSLQEMVLTVQTAIGKFASLGESIKNLFNFTVPYLSCLAIFICLIIALVMYLIPVKYIFMCWGVHKFTRKILRPNRIPNNEILDLLSRVPDDETLMDCETLSLDENTDEDDKIM